jgi:hypothetical protein
MLFVNFLIVSAQSSSLFIDSLRLIPTSPTEIDSVSFIAYTWHPNQDGFYEKQVVKQDSVISIFSCWVAGSFPSVEYVNDTFHLGQLPHGNYRIRYILKFLSSSDLDSIDACLTNSYYDSAFLNIVVKEIVNVVNFEMDAVSLHPNPATTQLTLTIPPPTQPITATITDVNGRLLRKEQLLNATNTLNIAELPAGLYFIAVQSAEQRWVRRFVKQ